VNVKNEKDEALSALGFNSMDQRWQACDIIAAVSLYLY